MNNAYQILRDEFCSTISIFYVKQCSFMRRFWLCCRKQLLNKKKVTIKKAMKRTFWKHSMTHLSNKIKALSKISLNLKTDNQTKEKQQDLEHVCFFVLIICSKISKFNSCNTTDVTRSKKKTHNSTVTRETNQQIKLLNNWTEQSCSLPVTHHEISLPLHNPKCTYFITVPHSSNDYKIKYTSQNMSIFDA